MLSTLLTQVGTVLSRLFIFASFVPTLIFTFLNGLLLYLWHPGFREWIAPQITGTAIAFYLAAAIVAMAVVAYVLFALNNSLRVVLERGRLLPKPLREACEASEQKRLQHMVQAYHEARSEHRTIKRLRDRDSRLTDAITVGAGLAINRYDSVNDPAAKKLQELQSLMLRNLTVASVDVDDAITRFASALSTNNKDRPPTGPNSLDDQHLRLLELLDYGVDRWKFREMEYYNKRQFEFGRLTPEPTRLGNIAQALQGYASSRYRLNLELLGTRFLNALRGEKEALVTIEDAKVQLDFLVAFCWLSTLSTLLWMLTLVVYGSSVIPFVAVALLGPVLSYVFYRFAVESYKVFTDVMRAALDQHRFKILDAMGLANPDGLREERQIWEAVENLVGGGGEYLELSYRARAKVGPT